MSNYTIIYDLMLVFLSISAIISLENYIHMAVLRVEIIHLGCQTRDYFSYFAFPPLNCKILYLKKVFFWNWMHYIYKKGMWILFSFKIQYRNWFGNWPATQIFVYRDLNKEALHMNVIPYKLCFCKNISYKIENL